MQSSFPVPEGTPNMAIPGHQNQYCYNSNSAILHSDHPSVPMKGDAFAYLASSSAPTYSNLQPHQMDQHYIDLRPAALSMDTNASIQYYLPINLPIKDDMGHSASFSSDYSQSSAGQPAIYDETGDFELPTENFDFRLARPLNVNVNVNLSTAAPGAPYVYPSPVFAQYPTAPYTIEYIQPKPEYYSERQFVPQSTPTLPPTPVSATPTLSYPGTVNTYVNRMLDSKPASNVTRGSVGIEVDDDANEGEEWVMPTKSDFSSLASMGKNWSHHTPHAERYVNKDKRSRYTGGKKHRMDDVTLERRIAKHADARKRRTTLDGESLLAAATETEASAPSFSIKSETQTDDTPIIPIALPPAASTQSVPPPSPSPTLTPAHTAPQQLQTYKQPQLKLPPLPPPPPQTQATIDTRRTADALPVPANPPTACHTCPNCGNTFDRIQNMRRHTRYSKTCNPKASSVSCDRCSKTFSRVDNLKRHERQEHQ